MRKPMLYSLRALLALEASSAVVFYADADGYKVDPVTRRRMAGR